MLGRTTFVNTLCGKKVLQGKDADDATNAHLEEGVRIKPITVGTCRNESIHVGRKADKTPRTRIG
jgi:septin family protein